MLRIRVEVGTQAYGSLVLVVAIEEDEDAAEAEAVVETVTAADDAVELAPGPPATTVPLAALVA